MAKTQGTVTKIYELKTIGFKDITKELDELSKKFEQVKKAKNEALKEKARVKNQDTKEVEELNKKIQEEIKLEKQLTLEIKKKIAERKKQKLVDESVRNEEFSKEFTDNSIAKARAENRALTKERNLLNLATEEGVARQKELNEQIDRNNDFIRVNVSNLEKQKINIGNYEGSAKIIVEAMERAREKVQQVETQFGKMSPEATAARHEFQSLERITENPQFLNVAAKVGDANAELKFFTKSLIDMERRGLGSSETANRLRDALARLTDEIKDTKEEVRALSSDTRKFDVVASGISTFTSSLQTAVGVSAIFGDSQEDLQKKMAFLLAVENTANGVRAIANDLTTRGTAANKLYAFVQAQVAIATNASAAAGLRAVAVMKLFALAATVIGAIVVAFIALNSKISEAARRQKDLNEIMKEASTAYGDARANLAEMKSLVQLAKDGFISKKEVLKEYNDTMGKTTGQLSDFSKLEKKLVDAGPEYIKAMFLRAQATAAFAFAAKIAAEQVEDLLTPDTRNVALNVGVKSGVFSEEEVQAEEKKRADKRQADFEKRINDAFEFGVQKNKEAAEIFKKFGFDFFGKGDTAKKTNEEKDAFARIDAIRDTAIANEQRRVLEIKKVRGLTLDEEIAHLKEIEKINAQAIDSKIKYLNNKKKLDAGDLKSLAELKKSKVELELGTLDEIQKVRDEEFDKRQKTLNEQLERDLKAERRRAEELQNDPTLSPEGRAREKLASDARILGIQEKFNAEMDALEKRYVQKSTDNAKQRADAVTDIEQQIKNDIRELSLSRVDDIRESGEREVRQIHINFSVERQAILNNTNLTDKKRKALIDKLDRAEQRTVLSAEIDRLLKELEIKKQLLELGLIAEAQYQETYLELQQKYEQLQDNILESGEKRGFGFQKMFRKIFNIEEGSEEDQALGEILSQSYDLAMQAMNNYFDAEEQRIRDNMQLQLDRLQLEQEQVTARAQSQAEIESIEKQFAARKRAAEREANEALKRQKRSQAKIAFAVELANIAVQASEYPFPASLIIGGILTALAAGRLALNLSAINREKFAKGGAVEEKGGRVPGKSHSQGGYPFNYEAERGELFVINKRSTADNKVRTFRGTNRQVASMINQLGGGVSFAGGGRTSRFALGGSLEAPVFTPSSTSGVPAVVSNNLVEALNEHTEAINKHAVETSRRIDRIEVYQKTSTVTDAQKKAVRQSSVASF